MKTKRSSKEIKDRGFVYLPYVTRVEATIINGEVAWYRNKWKNFLLKIKHFFIKPKYLKNLNSRYSEKKIDPNYYTTINVQNKDE